MMIRKNDICGKWKLGENFRWKIKKGEWEIGV